MRRSCLILILCTPMLLSLARVPVSQGRAAASESNRQSAHPTRGTAAQPANTPAIAIGDSLYNANHPKMLFTPADLPALQAKVADGGYDDDAYNQIRILADLSFPLWGTQNLLLADFGTTTIPILGVATYLASPEDSASETRGRDVTLYIADNYNVDFEETGSAFRLEALTLGYDMFFRTAADSLRQRVVSEIESYLQTMTAPPFTVWERRPYLANHSAMVAAALGLAAVCFADEANPTLVSDAMEAADAIVDSLLLYQFDPAGSYKEGSLYLGWTMRHLAYYFYARKRFDGVNYGDHPRVREVENWVPYELLPEGQAHLNNMNDSPYSNFPLSYHHTFFDYAQSEWGSTLSAWIWERVAGPYGLNTGLGGDKVATVLWNQNLPPQDPNAVLPKSKLWKDRGLYHYRTGWQTGMSSDDVMFTFFSGKFHGGHAQEDQNQFTLYGYGSSFVIDHGPGAIGKQSEAHNIVLVDGKGLHNAGGSIGIDGEISKHLLNGFADYIQGDATKAYTTHSPFNNAGYPFPGSDWSWGYDGGNPVDHAIRDVVAVHSGSTAPYFIIMDDIDKDGTPRNYEWQLHTLAVNDVDSSDNPVRITDGASWMNVYSAGHAYEDLTIAGQFYDNLTPEPDATRLTFSITAENPRYAFVLIPGDETVAEPAVATTHHTWGSLTTLDWGGGLHDYYVFNPTRTTVTIGGSAPGRPGKGDPSEEPRLVFGNQDPLLTADAILHGDAMLTTDAAFALVRFEGSVVTAYLTADARVLNIGSTPFVRVDGSASCALSGSTISMDRDDVDFVFYGPQVTEVRYRDEPVGFTKANGYLMPSTGQQVSAIPGEQPFTARITPNPFNPTAQLIVDLEATTHARIAVYDVRGKQVVTLWDGSLAAGSHAFDWTGQGTRGPAASGVYFFRIEAGGTTRTLKATLLK
jgi:hypothetical protein